MKFYGYSRRRNYRKNETGKSLVYGIVPKMVIYRFGIIEKHKKIPQKLINYRKNK